MEIGVLPLDHVRLDSLLSAAVYDHPDAKGEDLWPACKTSDRLSPERARMDAAILRTSCARQEGEVAPAWE